MKITGRRLSFNADPNGRFYSRVKKDMKVGVRRLVRNKLKRALRKDCENV